MDWLRRVLVKGSIVLIAVGLTGCSTMDFGGQQASVAPVAAGGTGSGSVQMVADLPPPQNTDNGTTQPIAPNDILTINIFGVPDLSRDVQIDPDGNANLALVGNVHAAGETVDQFQKDLTRAYGSKYLQSPSIMVSMKEAAGQQVTVDGEVMKTGIYSAMGRATLGQIIAQAGGLTRIADDSKVFVFRNFGDRRLVARYSIADIRNGKKTDPSIYGGDAVIVFASGTSIALQGLTQSLGLATTAASLGRL